MVTFAPLRQDSDGNKHIPASIGSVIDSAYIPVSVTIGNLISRQDDGLAFFAGDMVSEAEGNCLTLQVDNKLFVKQTTVKELLSSDKGNALYLGQDAGAMLSYDSLITKDTDNVMALGDDGKLKVKDPLLLSKQDGNYLQYGNDKALYLDGSNIISTDSDNTLTLSPTDGKLKTKDQLLLSGQEGNYLQYGNDKALHLTGNDLISVEEGNLLMLATTDGKLKVDNPWYHIEDILSNEDCEGVGESGCNLLAVDSCGRLRFRAIDIVKADPQQMIEVEDCKLVVRPETFISDESDSCIGVDNEGKLHMRAISADADNNLSVGSDCGAYMPCNYGTMD